MNPLLFIFVVIVVTAIVCAVMLTQKNEHARDGGESERAESRELVSMSAEYEKWLLAMKRLKLIDDASRDTRAKYEARAILERWSLTVANAADNSETLRHAEEKMRQEILDKRIVRNTHAAEILSRGIASASILQQRSSDSLMNLRTSRAQEGGINFEYSNFSTTISEERYRILREYAPDEHIAATLMRYASQIPAGQQWSIPRATYEIMVRSYGLTLEGFASPFNSQIMRFKKSIPSAQFCSLFPDTDSVFGSVGNFFDCDLRGKVSCINPPFIESLIDRVVEKCIAESQSQPTQATRATLMFIVVPTWTDAAFYSSLKGARNLEKKIVREPGRTFFEDVSQEKMIRASFSTTIFILSSGDDLAHRAKREFADIEGAE